MKTEEDLHKNLAEDRGKILVVDDDQIVLAALENLLKREGYEVHAAKSGQEAVAIIDQKPLALVICDQRMPGMSGIEVLQHAREIRPDTVRILLTGNHDINTAINAINVGQVNQYITKPWDNHQLIKTVRQSLDSFKLVRENQVLQELIFTQHKKLEKTHKGLRHELELGAQIHEKLLLGKVPRDIPGITIEALSEPSKEIDGDFFEFYRPIPKILDMVIGDVMGKGIAAALVGTAMKTQLIRFAMPFPLMEVFDKERGWGNNILSPEEILKQVDHELSEQLIHLGYFVSLFYGRFDLQYKKLTFIDCGSAKPIHYKANEKKAETLTGNNFPIGVIKENAYQSFEASFTHGDFFVFYSDGVTEAQSPEQELFGSERLVKLVEANHDARAKELLQLIKQAVISFSQNETFVDDLTIVVMKIGHYDRPELAEFAATQCRSDFGQLQSLRDFIRRFCLRAPGDSERLGYEMQLLVDEAFCNIVKHGYREDPTHHIHIRCELTEEGVLIRLSDHGIAFEPSDVNEPSFTGNRDTGYGWHIIRTLSDTITYTKKENDEGWNHLTVFKRFYFGENRMNFAHTTEGKILIITPEGESLDAKDAPQFKEEVVELISNEQITCVVFDLNRLQFIDSSGLGSFLSVLRVLNARGGDLKLSCMNKPIRTMFELVKMHKIFEIFSSTEDAVRSFR